MCEETAYRLADYLRAAPRTCAVLDEDAVFRVMLAEFLRRIGFKVDDYENSNVFIQENKENRYDLVFLSWGVVPLSGSEVVRELKRNGKPWPALIVECDGSSVSLHLEIPPAGFLFKPFDAEHLLNILDRAIGGRE